MKRLRPTVILIVITILGLGVYQYAFRSKPTVFTQTTTQTLIVRAAKPAQAKNNCAAVDQQAIVISISQRHLWACAANTQVYDSAVVTGDMTVAANLTPVGNYKIYAKQTDRFLKGSDEKGSWNEHVDYWMPFLYNQYGAYGFHDASWRNPSQFGRIDPYSYQASHGCVELPTPSAAWLYNWSSIGTVVTVQA